MDNVKMINYTNNEEFLRESGRNMRKLILIENLDELGFKTKKRNRFINYYYQNLHLNLLEALDKFKKL